MQDINKHISENFSTNIEYIQKNHKELFEKLSALDSAVENGHYLERFELVYENDNFDVFEKSTSNYLYNKKLSRHTHLSVKDINKDVDNNMYEGFFKRSYSDEMIKEFQKIKEKQPLKSHLGYTTPIMHFTQKETDKRKQLHSLDKFIFFGVGLGSHISAIDKDISGKVYLIVEDSLELFRLSLFVTNYALLAKKASLFFSIFEDDTEFSQSCDLFLKEKYYLNHAIKYSQLLSHSEDKANKFYIALLNQDHLQFFFNDYMHIMLKPLEYFSQGYKVIQDSFDFQYKELQDIPTLLIASGPSLQNNIEWLKKNKKHFIIIAVSSTMKFLDIHDVTPDIVIHLDPFDASLSSFEIIQSSEKLKNSIFFMAASSPTNVMSILKTENTYLYETGTTYHSSGLKIFGACIGSITYQLTQVLQSKEVYLLGLDLAVDQKTGKDHTDIHQSTKQLTLKNDLQEDTLSYKNNLFEIKGNFQEKVFTTPHFYSSVDIINRYFTKFQKTSQKVYNLSNGAFFKATLPLQPSEVKLTSLKDKNLHTLLQNILSANTRTEFSKEDINRLKTKLKHAKKLKKQLSAYKLTLSAEGYAKDIYAILIQKEMLEFHELTRVLDAYLYYILHFVYDYLNSSNKNPKDYEQIDQILKKEIFALIDYYINTLQLSIKEL